MLGPCIHMYLNFACVLFESTKLESSHSFWNGPLPKKNEREQHRKILMKQERIQTQGVILPLWWKLSSACPWKGLIACQVLFLYKQTAWRRGQETLAQGEACFPFLRLSRGAFSPRFGDQGNMPYWSEKHQQSWHFYQPKFLNEFFGKITAK